jgi:integrase-like protein
VKRYILFHRKRHPAEMGPAEITQFLTALAVERRVGASTQNQALAALLGVIPAGSTRWCGHAGRGGCRSFSRAAKWNGSWRCCAARRGSWPRSCTDRGCA